MFARRRGAVMLRPSDSGLELLDAHPSTPAQRPPDLGDLLLTAEPGYGAWHG